MKTPVTIAVTGCAGQICYSLLFRIAAGNLLGSDQPVNLRLLEIEPAMKALTGVVMELNDCAFPLLHSVETTSDPMVAFQNAEIAFLVGSQPRGPGMERKDLLLKNAAIFKIQGQALDQAASRHVKVLVVGNPANTNALIALKNAPKLDPNNFTAMTMLDHNRAKGQLAEKCGVLSKEVSQIIIWGNHSSTQYPDLHHALVKGRSALTLVDNNWFVDHFIPTVQKRGAAIIDARGLSSAASAANAAIDHMRAWLFGTLSTDWASMAITGPGWYGVESELFFSYPVRVINSRIIVEQDLPIDEFSQKRLKATELELKEERDMVRHLF